jgi:hypothetical protein
VCFWDIPGTGEHVFWQDGGSCRDGFDCREFAVLCSMSAEGKIMKPQIVLGVVMAGLCVANVAHAGSERVRHPIVGNWTLDVPSLSCHEVYHIFGNGTSLVTSADEVSESRFEITDRPSQAGFYKWVDLVTKSNGGKDCLGNVTPVGHRAIKYVIFDRSGNRFLICNAQNLKACVGPLVRMEGMSI